MIPLEDELCGLCVGVGMGGGFEGKENFFFDDDFEGGSWMFNVTGGELNGTEGAAAVVFFVS